METWERAWKWAKSQGYEPGEFNIDAPYKEHIYIRNMWFSRGGPRTGPSKIEI